MSNGFNEEICSVLRKPMESFTRRGPGGNFSYYKGSDVIKRLNESFNHSWSSEKLEVETIEDQVLMLVSLTVYCNGGDVITHQGYGSADIARSRTDKKIINIGNTYKSAFTNALKKAAEQFGIGLQEDTAPLKKPQQSSGVSPQYASPAAKQAATPRPSMNRPSMDRPSMDRETSSMSSGTPMGARPKSGLVSKAATAAASILAKAAAMETTRMPMTTPTAIPVTTAPAAVEVAVPPVNPAPMESPQPRSDLISPIQETALENLLNMKALKEVDVVMGALPNSGKVSFKELLRTEAVEVIKYANVQPQGVS